MLPLGGSPAGASGKTVRQRTVSAASLKKTNRRIQNFTRAARHWENVLEQPYVRFSPPNGCSVSLECAKWVLKKRQAVSRHLHLQAKRWMVQRTEFFLADAARLRTELGMSPDRNLTAVQGVEARFIAARRLDRQLAKKWRASSLYYDLMCIHSGMRGNVRVGSGEGGMTSVSRTNPPYYGGWQMDITFQRKYGAGYLRRWGTADHWPAWAQLETAAKAYRSGRGFYPWPYTARDCGLL